MDRRTKPAPIPWISPEWRHNLAVRVLRWCNSRRGSGVAQMEWQVLSGDYRIGYNWQTNWSIPGVPLQPGINEITVIAEDITGLASGVTLTVTSGSLAVPAAPTGLTAAIVSPSQIDLS